MNISKLVGPYSIPTNILKLSSSLLSKPLAKLINFSFSEGVFPDLLKLTIDYNNYRPLSLISNIGKQIEKIKYSIVF